VWLPPRGMAARANGSVTWSMGAHGHPHHHEHGAEHAHAHDHVHAHAKAGVRALVVALVVTGLFCVAEVVAGVWSGSLALLSDAAHMLTDSLGLFVAVVAAVLARRPRSARSTFGFARLPVLGGLVNAVLVLLTAGAIVLEAIERLREPRVVPGLSVVVVATLGLVVNLAMAWWVHREGDQSVNTRGAVLHMLGDALGSVAAIVSGVVLMTTSLLWIDPIASLVVAGIIGVGAIRLLFDVSSILLERAPARLDVAAVERVAREVPSVVEVLGLHAWELDSGDAVASLVLVTTETNLVELARQGDTLKAALEQRFAIAHATIEWRPEGNAKPCCPAA
jgi:cobalt-zinc-cadmium efflux system protein